MRTFMAMLVAMAISAWAPAACARDDAELSHAGKAALVTGSTDGLGREIARALAARGAHVIVHGRNAERGAELVEEINAAGVGSAKFYPADFASLATVRAFAERIARDYPRLDLLVNNAGVLIGRSGERRESADGHELQFAVNYLANWILVHELRTSLAAAAPSRIVNVASVSARAIDFDDVMLEQPGAARRGYGQSKLAQVSMTVELAPDFLKDGITMIAAHPATMMDTAMVTESGMTARTSVNEGRDHIISLITAPELEPGAFYVAGKAVRAYDPQPYDAAARARLMQLSAELTGVPRS